MDMSASSLQWTGIPARTGFGGGDWAAVDRRLWKDGCSVMATIKHRKPGGRYGVFTPSRRQAASERRGDGLRKKGGENNLDENEAK
jgi:hypothetical protein